MEWESDGVIKFCVSMSTLFVVATPIGNLSDVSTRALETLRSVDALLCEDTRVTAKLLARFDIRKTLIAFHQHSTQNRFEAIFERLESGENLALVTDAGTPGISDPGARLVKGVTERFGSAVTITPVPGPSALIAALSISGFSADTFIFLGFPPHKKGRKTFFDKIAQQPCTVVFYESTHRILKALAELELRLANRQIVVCRELTKLHETIYRGTSTEVTEQLQKSSIKGEFVIVL